MKSYETILKDLQQTPHTWLVTGAAGFIGGNLVEHLLRLGQRVVGLDNFSTGRRRNLTDIEESVGAELYANFNFIEGDIRNFEDCERSCVGVDYVLHQAALGSVPRSIAHPLPSHASNVNGFVNMIEAARHAGVKRFVYASSSSVYGSDANLPKQEHVVGEVLSPYAATKAANELYAKVFSRVYSLETVGLRYFNVFGRRQDPEGVYAAVIPKWVASLLNGEPCLINGDGETSRDFCYIENVLQANVLAAVQQGENISGQVFNVALGNRTTLNDLFKLLRQNLVKYVPAVHDVSPKYADFRAGDIRHSLADTSKANAYLMYSPTHSVDQGVFDAIEWYVSDARKSVDLASSI